jgi:hypothetical protein
MRSVTITTLTCVLVMLLVAEPAVGRPARPASEPAGQLKSGVNMDALTVDDCRQRLALPKSKRAVDPDPGVDLDAVCRNILSGLKTTAPPKAQAHPPNAASSAR